MPPPNPPTNPWPTRSISPRPRPRRQTVVSGPAGGPIQTEDMTVKPTVDMLRKWVAEDTLALNGSEPEKRN